MSKCCEQTMLRVNGFWDGVARQRDTVRERGLEGMLFLIISDNFTSIYVYSVYYFKLKYMIRMHSLKISNDKIMFGWCAQIKNRTSKMLYRCHGIHLIVVYKYASVRLIINLYFANVHSFVYFDNILSEFQNK